MKSVITNLQHQDPQTPTRRSPSPPSNTKYRSLTPPTHQSKRSVAFADPFSGHTNPPPMVFVCEDLQFSHSASHLFIFRPQQAMHGVLLRTLFEVHLPLNKENIEKFTK